MSIHRTDCECNGEGLLPVDQPDGHGGSYLAWKRCSGTGQRLPAKRGPVMSWNEFEQRNPDWRKK